jgi:hypothetical protein
MRQARPDAPCSQSVTARAPRRQTTRRGGRAGAKQRPTTVVAPGRARARLTFLPPPLDRSDPLAIADLGAAAEARSPVPALPGLHSGEPLGARWLCIKRVEPAGSVSRRRALVRDVTVHDQRHRPCFLAAWQAALSRTRRPPAHCQHARSAPLLAFKQVDLHQPGGAARAPGRHFAACFADGRRARRCCCCCCRAARRARRWTRRASARWPCCASSGCRRRWR